MSGAGRAAGDRPHVIARLLRLVLPAHRADELCGDLIEHAKLEPRGFRRLIWYGRELFLIGAWIFLRALRRRTQRWQRPSISKAGSGARRRGDMSFPMDARIAWRSLTRRPGFLATAALTLALVIGANVTVYGMVRGVLARPLPYPAPEELVAVWPELWASKAQFAWLQERLDAVDTIAAYAESSRTLVGAGTPDLLMGPTVSAGFFELLQVDAYIGRLFQRGDDQPGAENVVVLTHGTWSTRFGGDASVIGQTVSLDEIPTTVIGVLPPGFDLIQPGAEIATPLRIDPAAANYATGAYLKLFGRLARDVELERARAELLALIPAFRSEFETSERRAASADLVSLLEFRTASHRSVLNLLWAAVTFLLLLACANVAALTLSRARARRGDLAIRMAIGSGRLRLLRGTVFESLIVASLGATLGVLVGWVALRAIRTSALLDLPRTAEVGIDPGVVAFTLAIVGAITLLSGLIPAALAARTDPARALGSRSATGAGASRGSGRAIVALQVAISIVLLSGAGLALQSFRELTTVDAGFDVDGVSAFTLLPSPERFEVSPDVTRYYGTLLERLVELPGVERAGTIHALPVLGGGWMTRVQAEDVDYESPDDAPRAFWRVVSPGYFAAMGIGAARGRLFDGSEEPAGQPVVVINAALARSLWQGSEPVGRRLVFPGTPVDWNVVGIIPDTRHAGLGEEPVPTAYLAEAQAGEFLFDLRNNQRSVVVASPTPLEDLLPRMREAIWELDASVPIVNPLPMRRILSDSLSRPRTLAFTLSAFGLAAALLSALGVYGTLSLSVHARSRELSMRRALGATPSRVMRTVAADSIRLLVLSLPVALVLGVGTVRFVEQVLFRTQPYEPVVIATVIGFVCVVALIASYVPARRAARTDPAAVLRDE